MSANPEALAVQLETLLEDWTCAHLAADLIRRQHAEIEALRMALTSASRALERIALGGESPEDTIDDALISEVNGALALNQQV